MRNSEKFIQTLRQASDRLRHCDENTRYDEPNHYNWKAIGACNCGQLAQILTGKSARNISNAGIKKHGDWQSISKLYNKHSGLEIDEIITITMSHGFVLEDFTEIENLSNPYILEFMGGVILKRDNNIDASNYFAAWANMIEHNNSVEVLISAKEEEVNAAY